MKMRKLVFVAVTTLTVALQALPAAAAGTQDQSQLLTDQEQTICGLQAEAQTFTAGLTGKLDQVDLVLRRATVADPGSLTVAITTTSAGVPTATVLASTTVASSDVGTTIAFRSFAFTTPASVTAGTQYAIVASAGGTCGGEYVWTTATSNPYAGGQEFTESGGWFSEPDNDMAFKTFVTQLTQNIVFGPLYDRPLTKPAITVTATAPGGTVTFTTTTPDVCSSSGTNGATITPLSVGVCTVKADQAGDATYLPATKSRSFNVTKGSQSISFTQPPDRPLSNTPYNAVATATSGLAVTFTTSTPDVCTSGGTNGATISLHSVGVCTVLADQSGGANYLAAAQKSRSFTVTKGSQSIAFGILGDRKLSKSPFTVSATASSGLTATFTSTTPSVCTSGGANGATISLLTTGTCTIKADQAGDANYNAAASKTRSFTVTTG